MYEEVSYERPFLKQVIARIDFIAAADALQKSVPPSLAKTISDHFPIVEPGEAFTTELQIQLGEKVQEKQTIFKQWNYYGRDREKQCALAPSFVFTAYTRYTIYENMRDEFGVVIRTIEDAFPDLRAARFGLRYINNIEVTGLTPPTKWDEYICPELLGMEAFSDRAEHLTRLFHVAELKYGDLNVRFQFGMPNPDSPAVIKRPLFTLDLDAYAQSAHEFKQALLYMDEAHNHIQDLFERS